LETALDALAATDNGNGNGSGGSSGSSSSSSGAAVAPPGSGLAVISEDPSAAGVAAVLRERLQRLRDAKGAPSGFSEAFKQVQLEVEELRRQNGELHRTLDHAHAQLKHQVVGVVVRRGLSSSTG
jgi:hypothetical protein